MRPFIRWLQAPLNLVVTLAAVVPFTVLVKFMAENGRNLPRFDQHRSFFIVYNTQDGTLSLADLFTPYGEQMTVFSHLQTAIFTALTDWNLYAEMWWNLVLGVLVYAVLLWLVARSGERLVALVVLPLSLLVFMVRQDANWTNGYMSQWLFAVLFWLVALALMYRYPQRIEAAMLAGLFGFFATVSQAVGVVTWVAVGFFVVVRPKRNWRVITVWGMAAILSVGFYLFSTPKSASVAASTPPQTLLLALGYALAQIGTAFEAFSWLGFLIGVGGVGVGLLLLNAWQLWREASQREFVALWLSVAVFGFVSAYLIGVGRIPEDGFERIFFTWYTTAIIPFWVALAVIGAQVTRQSFERQSSRWAGYVNIIAAGVLMTFYVPSNQNGLNKTLAVQWRGVTERCVMQYIFVQDDIPFCELQNPELYQYNQLAARRLALYAGRLQESILHADATDNAPVIVETHTPWLNVHIRDYFLHGVDRERIYHIYPTMPETLAQISTPPEQGWTDFSAAGVEAMLATVSEWDNFWYVRRADYDTAIPEFWEALQEQDYLILDTRERNDGMLVSRVQVVPPTLENSPRFGEALQLRAVTQVNTTVAACDTIQVNSFWTATDTVTLDYSGSLRLLNADGVKVAQSDAQLGITPTGLWELDGLYVDERELAVPCDLPAGTYTLAFGVYYYQAPDVYLTLAGGESAQEENTLVIREVEVTVAEES
jgi:hypothetical protein